MVNKQELSDFSLIINSKIVAKIKEARIFLGHMILERVEDKLLKNEI